MRPPAEIRRRTAGEALRFLLAGGLNTLATLLLYWLLLGFGYGVAYTISYVAGIALAYWLQGRFVFQARTRTRHALLFPLIYVIQYGVGMLVLWIWHDHFGLPEKYGVFASIATTLPLTFVLSRTLFRHGNPPSVPLS